MKIQYWFAILTSCLIMIAVSLGTTGLSFFVQPVTEDLGFDRSSFTLYFTFIALVGIISMPIIGRTINRWGSKRLITLGGIWTAIGFLWLSRSSTLISFYAAGMFIGIMLFASTNMAAIIIINTWFAAKKGLILGVVMASTGVGGGMLGIVMPWFIDEYGWRNGYLLLGGLFFLLTVPPAIFLLKNSPQQVGLLPYGKEITKEMTANQTGIVNIAETGVPYTKALKSIQFYALYLAIALYSLVIGFIQHIPAYLTEKGFSSGEAGVLVSILMVSMIFSKIMIGFLNDHFNSIVALTTIIIFYMAALIIIPSYGIFGVLTVAMILMSFGTGAPTVLPPLIASKVFGQKDYAGIWSVLITAGSLGMAIGTPLWGVSYDLMGTYNVAIYSSIGVLTASFLLFLYCLKTSDQLWE